MNMYSIRKFINHMLANHSVLFFGMIIVIIVIIGTLCFHFIEGRDLFLSFYFTTVTMATVGYWDMAPLTHWGKIFAIIYGFMGAPLFIWLTWVILQWKFHKVIKSSIHEYHKEMKEAQKEADLLWEDLKKQHELQQETIKEMEQITPELKKPRWKRLFRRQ